MFTNVFDYLLIILEINSFYNKQIIRLNLNFEEKMKTRGKNKIQQLSEVQFVQNTKKQKNQCKNIIQTSDKQQQGKKINADKWTTNQYRCFLQYFIDVINENPFIVYSFNSPLKRKDNFKHMSQHMARRLGSQNALRHGQCKSKFTTIKRKVHRRKMAKKLPSDYSFLDYIFEQSQKIQQAQQYKQKISILKQKLSVQSSYMKITKQLLDIHTSKHTQEMNNYIYAYLHGLNKYNN